MITMRVTSMALVLISVLLLVCGNAESWLKVGFYDEKCPQAESIIKSKVKKAFKKNKGLVASIVRMEFHDCFVRGCDGSILIDSTANNTAEKDSVINNPSLRGFNVIYRAKAKLESVCKGIVSCADIIAFAARDSIEITGGPAYEVPAGRRDGRVSLASETLTNLPAPTFNLNNLTKNFAAKGLTQDEMVTLSGAHTIGRSHCTSFNNRLYNFSTTVKQDPTLNRKYAAILKKECPNVTDKPNLVVPMDPTTPAVFDINYYANLFKNEGLFTSDQTLLSKAATAKAVKKNVAHPSHWEKKFAAAMIKMGNIGVLTGTKGEIRADCRKINP
ncbi:hypothetical protein MLD38_002973 [Melastoma candidum]|uniref:Uncharacterized protein n=1 Tax=Melastoma candidum TaxID=119954 RepID=A0ACB9S0U9_9MYRT|nr:hypothetical protein MLD38_002973 [Melastoma candidum]